MENPIVRHILLGKFRPEMTAAQFDEIIRRFHEMVKKLPGTLSFEHGENNSSEGRDLGMTQVIIITFRDAAARDAYLVHPDHIRFSTWLAELNLIQELVVVDFTPKTVDHHL
jgi:quinol monooxygenase YgiN